MKLRQKIMLGILLGLIILTVIGFWFIKKPNNETTLISSPLTPEQIIQTQEELPAAEPANTVNEIEGITYVNGIMIVNKTYGLPQAYAPGENQEAKAALLALISEGQTQGLNISNNYSGFRSYEYQDNLYQGYVVQYGADAANTFSAPPGHSEHQSGLAFDLIGYDGELVTDSATAEFIATNCHKYGFILRYPQAKEAITGYQYEPWHLRYVGVEVATQIMSQNITLEEYLGLA